MNPAHGSPEVSDDDSILSDSFLENFCLKYLKTPSNQNLSTQNPDTYTDTPSFADKYLYVQTPDTPKVEHTAPISDLNQHLLTARKNIQDSRATIRKLILDSPPQTVSHINTTKFNIMEKLGSCRKFAGYPQENGSKFLREFESFCKLHELDHDHRKKLASFHLHLEGPALAWYNGLSPDLTWTTIKRLFKEKYVTIGWEHPSVVVESETFHNMSLAPSQEIEDYFCQVQEKGELLSKPNHEIMFRFINGLPDKLAFYVRTCQPKNLSEALSFSKQGEAYKYRMHEQCAATGKVSNAPRSDEIAELKSQISNLTTMMQSMSTNKVRQSGFEGNRCYNCSSTDHMKKQCNWNGNGQVSHEMTCQLCFQSGHGAIQCVKFKPRSDNVYERNRVVCQICSKPNHDATQCFRYTQQGNPNPLGDTRHGPSGR